MSEEEKKSATVFSLRSRKEVTAEEILSDAGKVQVDGNEGPEAVKLTEEGLLPACADTLRIAKIFVEQAEAGNTQGMIAIAWNQKHGTFDRVLLLPKSQTKDTVMLLHAHLGALKLMADDLSQFIAETMSVDVVDEGDIE
jgi:hypothetical protein